MIVELELPCVKVNAAFVLLASGTVTIKAELSAVLAPPVNVPEMVCEAKVPAEIVASLEAITFTVVVALVEGSVIVKVPDALPALITIVAEVSLFIV